VDATQHVLTAMAQRNTTVVLALTTLTLMPVVSAYATTTGVETTVPSALTMLVGVMQCASTDVMDLRLQTALSASKIRARMYMASAFAICSGSARHARTRPSTRASATAVV
jgi:hypothetical protein